MIISLIPKHRNKYNFFFFYIFILPGIITIHTAEIMRVNNYGTFVNLENLVFILYIETIIYISEN